MTLNENKIILKDIKALVNKIGPYLGLILPVFGVNGYYGINKQYNNL
jgi:hypothetical protein